MKNLTQKFKSKSAHYLCLFCLLFMTLSLNAQNSEFERTQAESDLIRTNPIVKKARLAENQNVLKMLKFEEGQQPDLKDLSTVINGVLQNSTERKSNQSINFKIVEDKIDELGYQQVKYQQLHQDIPVEFAFYKAQVSQGKVGSLIGRIYSEVNINNVTPNIGKEESLKIAEDNYCDKQEDCTAHAHNHLDESTLVILRDGGKDYLCWKHQVFNNSYHSEQVYIDAHTGTVIKTQQLYSDCNSGRGYTTMYGYKNGVYTDKPSANYILHNDCNSDVNIHVKDWNSETSSTNNPLDYYDSNNYWNDNSRERSAFQSLWATDKALEYLNTVHGRNSFDNQGTRIDVFNEVMFYDANSNTYYGENAAFGWVSGTMYIGRGTSPSSGNDDINSTDIIAHELFHGVTGTSSGLIYLNESGALNESFSDIFGVDFERWIEGSSSPTDWLIGEDLAIPHFRSMSNPNSKGHPDTYKGNYWYTGSGDNGGVHLNSGVQNFWFYLLSQGGSGTNDNGNYYSINGVGMTKAVEVAYRTLTVKLTDPNSDYLDARNASIQAAEDISGTSCSNLVEQVTNAWNAVGVGNKFSCVNTGPDLFTTNQSVSDTSPNIGQTISVSSIQNITGSTEYFYHPYPEVHYYLSNNTTLGSSDIYLGKNGSVLGSSQTSEYASNFITIPGDLGTGNKYILFVSDAENSIIESNENNNVKYVQININGNSGNCMSISNGNILHSFENTLDGWVQSTSDDVDWTIQTGGTLSGGTGPAGAYDGNYYLYVEASGVYNKEAVITSPCFDISNANTPYIAFGFHMKGNHVGELTFDFYGNGQWYNNRTTFSGQVNPDWARYSYNLAVTPEVLGATDFRVRIRATTGNGYQSDICIDKFEIYDGSSNRLESQTDLNQEVNAIADFTLFPNPASDRINLTFEKMDQIEEVFITNVMGQKTTVSFDENNGNAMNLDVSNLDSGCYYVTIVYNFGKIKTKKLLIQR